MKKLLLLAFVSLLFVTTEAFSQIRLGAKVGVTTGEYLHTEYQGGATLQIGLPLIGLKVQPEVLYSYNADRHYSYVQVPVHIQWGLDLILLRPYLSVSPNANLLVHHNWDGGSPTKFYCGVGLGGGLDIWGFQFQVHYNLTQEKYGRGTQFSLAYFF